MARTRILATLGPATATVEAISSLAEAGADAFRINFSHGTDDEHRTLLRACQSASSAVGRRLTTLADLQGPKVRLGVLDPSPRPLSAGSQLFLREGEGPSSTPELPVAVPGLLRSARPGQHVLLGDGSVELEIVGRAEGEAGRVAARVVQGGSASSHQGLYLPGAKSTPEPLTTKDLHDLEVAIAAGADWVALSFVRTPGDVERLQERVERLSGGRAVQLMAKIERAEALEHRAEILEVSDAIMVARGDLGIEVPLARLAVAQKTLVAEARAAAKPVVVATQMLLSMVHSARPTRAEATDAANAILDGADCLMLSEETAIGEFPRECVAYLRAIAEATEPSLWDPAVRQLVPSAAAAPPSSAPGVPAREELAVADASVRMAEEIGAKAIVVPSHSGRTARLVARRRPPIPILVLSSRAETPAALGLVWGTRCRHVPQQLGLEELRDEARRAAREELGLRTGHRLVLTAGYPVEGRPTNLLMVVEV